MNLADYKIHDYDWWCFECQKGFFEVSSYSYAHDADPKYKGHHVYDAKKVNDDGTVPEGLRQLYVTG